MPDPKAKAVHYREIPAQAFGEEAPGVTIRWLIDEEHDGAPIYAMRMIEIAARGHTPLHSHPFEHENFVLEGTGRLLIEGTWHDVGPGTVAFVPAGVLHTYENSGDGTFRYLCSIPVRRLQGK
jgi:quercetin dioxygenase-like cupin family protein